MKFKIIALCLSLLASTPAIVAMGWFKCCKKENRTLWRLRTLLGIECSKQHYKNLTEEQRTYLDTFASLHAASIQYKNLMLNIDADLDRLAFQEPLRSQLNQQRDIINAMIASIAITTSLEEKKNS